MHSDLQQLHLISFADISFSQPNRLFDTRAQLAGTHHKHSHHSTAVVSVARRPRFNHIDIVRNVTETAMMPLSARIKLASIHKILLLTIKPNRNQRTTHTAATLLCTHFHILLNYIIWKWLNFCKYIAPNEGHLSTSTHIMPHDMRTHDNQSVTGKCSK